MLSKYMASVFKAGKKIHNSLFDDIYFVEVTNE